MHKKLDPGVRRLDGSKPTPHSVKDSSTHIIEDYDSEIDYIPEFDFDDAMWVHNDEAADFHQEILSKGHSFIKRRLAREGHKQKSGDWVYVPPGKD